MKRKYLFFIAFFALFLLQSCDDSDDDLKEFSFKLEDNLNSSDFSSLSVRYGKVIVVNHNENYSLWKSGDIASSGLRVYVESGDLTNLESEIANAKSDENVKFSAQFDFSTDTTTYKFTPDKDYPLVSFVIRLIPGPDWFLGADSLEIFKNDSRVEELEGTLKPYDAGTQRGDDFSSSLGNEFPQEPIQEISGNSNIEGSNNRTDYATYEIK